MTDTDQGSQAANLGGQLQGGQQQGPPSNPWQAGGGPGPNPWREFVARIRPPMSLPVQPTGMNTGTPETVPQSDQPQNYIPARMRDSGWGQEDSILQGAQRYPGVTPGPFMPSGPLQIQQTMRASLAGLANIGSGDVSAMAGHSVAWQAAFLKARMQKQEWQARMAREQLAMNNEKLYQTQEKELTAYDEAFVKWKDKPDKLYDELYRIAQNGAGSGVPDKNMLDMLNDGDHAKGSLAGAKRLLGYRDHHWLNGRKAEQQIRDERDEQARKDWDETAPTTTPTTTPTPAPDATTGGARAAPAAIPPVPAARNPKIRQAAQALDMNEKPPFPPDSPDLEQEAYNDMQTLRNYYRKIPVDPKATPEQRRASIMPMVEAANPHMADLVGNILDGNLPTAAEAGKEPYLTALNIARKINPQASGVALDEASTSVARAIAEYRERPPALGTRNPQNRALMAEVLRINPNYRESGYKTVQDFRGAGRHADTMRSMDVAIDHMDALDEYAKALKTGNSQLINRAQAIFQQQTGAAAPQNVQEASAFVGAEVQKALGASTQRERLESAGYFGVANSPEQAIAATQVARRLLSGQLNGLRREYKNGTGLDDFDTLLDPRTVSVLDATRSGGGFTGRTAVNPSTGVRLRETSDGKWVP